MEPNCTAGFELPLSLLREQIAHSDLLPEPYGGYCAVVADALRFFLQRLSPRRLRAIFSEQLRLFPTAPLPERVVALLGHSPALHKLGQVLARDRRLAKSFRDQLQRLESIAPKRSIAAVTGRIDAACKGWRKAGIQLGQQLLAEGSVAEVIPFVWEKGRAGRAQAREGVFKLLKPGVRRRLEEDLEVLASVAAFLDARCDDYGLPALDYQATFDLVRELLLHEVRFEQEQQSLAEAGRIYSHNTAVVIPALLPFCSPTLTAMERLRGRRLPGAGGAFRASDSARLIVQALVARPIFSAEESALFHADPHGGNLLLLPDKRLGILDWSLTGRLPRPERAAVVQLILAAMALDVSRMERAVEQLAPRLAGCNLTAVLESSVRDLRWGAFPGLSWVIQLFDKLALRSGVRFSPGLLLFRKSLLTLQGMLADLLGEKENAAMLDRVVAEMFLKHWLSEWPERFLAPPTARSATTHLSTADMLALTWSSAGAATRWWSQAAVDWLKCWQPACGA